MVSKLIHNNTQIETTITILLNNRFVITNSNLEPQIYEITRNITIPPAQNADI